MVANFKTFHFLLLAQINRVSYVSHAHTLPKCRGVKQGGSRMRCGTRFAFLFGIISISAIAIASGCGSLPDGDPAAGDDDSVVAGVIDVLLIDPNELSDPNAVDDGADDGGEDDDEPAFATRLIEFTVDPISGDPPLTVTCTASTIQGGSLPEGGYTWSFDGVPEDSLMADNARRTHVFQKGGFHTVTLTVSLLGLSVPVGCVSKRTGTLEERVAVNLTVAGRVVTSEGAGVQGVVVTASPNGATGITNAQGEYALRVPCPWSGEVTCQHNQYTFDRTERKYTELKEDVVNQDFVVVAGPDDPEEPDDPDLTNVVVSGRILDAEGHPVTGVSLSATNDGGTATTDENGAYLFSVAQNWSGKITPSYQDYTFEPAERSYAELTSNSADQNFSAIAPASPTISGAFMDGEGHGIPGVQFKASTGETVTSDESGTYALRITQGWTGTVTPSHEGYTFSPEQRSYDNVTTDVGNQDFTATPLDVPAVSGSCLDEDGNGIANVTLTASTGETATSVENGSFLLTVSSGWSGTVSASREGYAFSPTQRSYTNVTSNISDQIFTGMAVLPTKTSTSTWQNTSFLSQRGVFEAEFDAVPNNNNMDGVTALSAGSGPDFSSFAVIVRFNASGTIDARNGSTYAASNAVSYTAGTKYHFRLEVDVQAHTYSVYVTPAGGTEQAIGEAYAFRTEQASVEYLNNLGLIAEDGTHEVSNFTVRTTGNQPPLANAGSDRTVTDTNEDGSESVSLSGEESSDSDGIIVAYCWSEGGTVLAEGTSPTASVSLAVGTHTLTLTVTDDHGATGTDTVRVTVRTPSSTGEATPIARWDTVPYQRINAGETLKCGVVAFSKNGIQKVSFSINGGAPIDATAMTYNDQSEVYEYWIPIRASDFTADGPITVEATVYGTDGGVRDKDTDGGGQGLDPLTLVVNPKGTLPQPQAWVDVNGSDATGQVNNASRPFATIGNAAVSIRDWMSANGHGNKVDGGIIRVNAGTHNMAGSYTAMAAENEWLTIAAASVGARENTRIVSNGTPPPQAKKLKVQGVTLQQSSGQVIYFTTANAEGAQIWVDDCAVIGSGRYVNNSNPIARTLQVKYMTDCYITAVDFAFHGDATGTYLARGLTIEHIGNDAFVRVPMIVNCTADDVDPGSTGWHADAWQWWGGYGDSNLICYNYRATGLHYQGIFWRAYDNSNVPLPDANGAAFVNVYMAGPGQDGSGFFCGFYRAMDHLLFWNCSFVDGFAAFMDDQYGGVSFPMDVTNFDGKGCVFNELKQWSARGTFDFSSWDHNHYVLAAGQASRINPGTNVTVGDPMLDGDGCPTTSSPLMNRISEMVVPVDAAGRTRTSPTTVGAYCR